MKKKRSERATELHGGDTPKPFTGKLNTQGGNSSSAALVSPIRVDGQSAVRSRRELLLQ